MTASLPITATYMMDQILHLEEGLCSLEAMKTYSQIKVLISKIAVISTLYFNLKMY